MRSRLVAVKTSVQEQFSGLQISKLFAGCHRLEQFQTITVQSTYYLTSYYIAKRSLHRRTIERKSVGIGLYELKQRRTWIARRNSKPRATHWSGPKAICWTALHCRTRMEMLGSHSRPTSVHFPLYELLRTAASSEVMWTASSRSKKLIKCHRRAQVVDAGNHLKPTRA